MKSIILTVVNFNCTAWMYWRLDGTPVTPQITGKNRTRMSSVWSLSRVFYLLIMVYHIMQIFIKRSADLMQRILNAYYPNAELLLINLTLLPKVNETQYLRRQLSVLIYANINCVILYNVLIDQLFNEHTLCNRTHFVFMTHFVYSISLVPYYKESN